MNGLFPEDSAARKEYPIYSGFLQYFPAAIAAIAHHSFKGNEKHNPGQPLHHDRAKSADEPDALIRHLMEGDYVGMAWRAMSLLQKHCEANGAPVAPAARNTTPEPFGLSLRPLTAEEISLLDGESATGIPPQAWVMQELACSDDPHVGGLKAGEAYDAHPGLNPVSQATGD